MLTSHLFEIKWPYGQDKDREERYYEMLLDLEKFIEEAQCVDFHL